MKIRETKRVAGGMGGDHVEERIRELGAKEQTPKGAEVVPDETPVTKDWQPVN
jgi:hypothetical protein